MKGLLSELVLNTSNRVTFTVNVQGTSSSPTVRCVIGQSPTLTFPAKELQNGKYESLLDLPQTLGEGSHPFKIEVLLNGRLFIPIQTSVNVIQENAKLVEPTVETNLILPKPAAKPAVSSFEEIKKLDSVAENKQPAKIQSRKNSHVWNLLYSNL